MLKYAFHLKMALLECSPIISQGIICVSVYILSVFQRCFGQCVYCYPIRLCILGRKNINGRVINPSYWMSVLSVYLDFAF